MAFGLSLFLTLRVNFHENLKQYIQQRLVASWGNHTDNGNLLCPAQGKGNSF